MLSRRHKKEKKKQDVKWCMCVHIYSTTTNMKKCLHTFVIHRKKYESSNENVSSGSLWVMGSG